jgi:hypothetical protein
MLVLASNVIDLHHQSASRTGSRRSMTSPYFNLKVAGTGRQAGFHFN